MENTTILIVVGKDCVESDLAKRLEAIRAIPAHAALLVVGELPLFPYYEFGLPAYGSIDISPEWQNAVASHHADLKQKADALEALLDRHAVSGDVATLSAELSQLADGIARRALLCDMVIIGADLRHRDSLFRQTIHGVLFQSPVGVLLNDTDPEATLNARTVFVGWTAQRHCARAVHQALPLLRRAETVVVGLFDPIATEYGDGEDPGVDLAKWLAHHGCNVSVRQFPSGGKEIGEVMLVRSKECGADLVVMGAYGHSRTRQAIFGGTTRTLIEQTGQAVFLAH